MTGQWKMRKLHAEASVAAMTLNGNILWRNGSPGAINACLRLGSAEIRMSRTRSSMMAAVGYKWRTAGSYRDSIPAARRRNENINPLVASAWPRCSWRMKPVTSHIGRRSIIMAKRKSAWLIKYRGSLRNDKAKKLNRRKSAGAAASVGALQRRRSGSYDAINVNRSVYGSVAQMWRRLAAIGCYSMANDSGW